MRMNVTTIYVLLLDEGIECWRPVQAAHGAGDRYPILSENLAPDDE